MRLTDLKIRKLSLEGGSKQKTYFDASLKGFGVRVSVGGSKSFVVMYGKQRRLRTIGRYPDMSLADARDKAKEVIGEVSGDKYGIGGAGASLAFSAARERFLEDSRARNKSSTYGEYKRLLEKHFTFQKKLGAITRHEVMEAVAALKASPGEAKHAFVAIRTMMNWAVVHGLIEQSPVPRLKQKIVTRSRVLTDDELKAVWNRAKEFGNPYGSIVQLLILTGQRRGEIAGLRRDWISDDSITFPEGFAKNKREHRIPLGAIAKAIIDAAPESEGLVFPVKAKTKEGDGAKEAVFSAWSKSKREFDKPLKIAPYTLHDLRRTFASNLARLGTPVHVTERILNHVSGTISGMAAVYNRYDYEAELAAGIEGFEQMLVQIVGA